MFFYTTIDRPAAIWLQQQWQEQMTGVEASKVHRSVMDGFSNSVLQV